MTKKSLAETHPEIAKQWHTTKNGNLTPYDVTEGSGKKVWWKCPKGDDHEWEASISHRSLGRKCPICLNKKIVNSNCLNTTHPHLAEEWHPTKNKNINPFNIGAGSNKKVWWKCIKGNDHEWYTSPTTRSRNNAKCPICSGKVIVFSNSLASTNPEIAKQWYYKKNGKLKPENFREGSEKKVWWKCPAGDDHIFYQSIVGRVKSGKKCIVCRGYKVVKSNSLKTTHPEIAKNWHPTKNGNLTPNDITSGSGKKFWWKCAKVKSHEYYSSINTKNPNRCPICRGLKVIDSTSLAKMYPDISKEWHPTKNGKLTPYLIHHGSSKKVWWKCQKGKDHEWEATVSNRTRNNTGCLICIGAKVVKSNCLKTTHPEIADEWHPIKNGNITPYDVNSKSSKDIWWICKNNKDHEWRVSIGNRTSGTFCPICKPGGYNPKLKGYLYVHLIYHENGKKIGLKFGITNNYGIRIKILEKGLHIYKLKNIFYFVGDGKLVNDIETVIKRKYNTGYINSEIMESGYSETIKYSDKILVEIYNLCNKNLKFKSGKKLYMKRLLNIFN